MNVSAWTKLNLYGSPKCPPLYLPAPQPPNFGGQVDGGDTEGGYNQPSTQTEKGKKL